MIPSDMSQRLRMLVDAALFKESQQLGETSGVGKVSKEAPDLQTGQRVLATIREMKSATIFRATIDDQDVQLELKNPARQPQVGEQVRLLITGRNTQNILAKVIGDKPTPTTADGGETNSVQTRLSPTAKIISELLQQPGSPQNAASRPVLNNPQLLMQTPPQSANQIAAALSSGIRDSGLFYESHQVSWLKGEYPEAKLHHEPQNQLNKQTNGQLYLKGTSPTSAESSAESSNGDPVRQSNGEATVRLASSDAMDSNNITRGNERLQQLVQQQLETLATQSFQAQLKIWPGQEMQLQIEEDEQNANTDEADAWKSTVRLELPQLGGIEARLELSGKNLRLRIHCNNANAAEQLKQHAVELKTALHNIDFQVSALDFTDQSTGTP